VRCTNTCIGSGGGSCSDGGPGAEFASCAVGDDCIDCGPRLLYYSPPPSPPAPPPPSAPFNLPPSFPLACSNNCTFASDGDCDGTVSPALPQACHASCCCCCCCCCCCYCCCCCCCATVPHGRRAAFHHTDGVAALVTALVFVRAQMVVRDLSTIRAPLGIAMTAALVLCTRPHRAPHRRLGRHLRVSLAPARITAPLPPMAAVTVRSPQAAVKHTMSTSCPSHLATWRPTPALSPRSCTAAAPAPDSCVPAPTVAHMLQQLLLLLLGLPSH